MYPSLAKEHKTPDGEQLRSGHERRKRKRKTKKKTEKEPASHFYDFTAVLVAGSTTAMRARSTPKVERAEDANLYTLSRVYAFA